MTTSNYRPQYSSPSRQDGGDSSTPKEIERLTLAVKALSIEVMHTNANYDHLCEALDKLSSNVQLINDRNLRQDTILSLICKVWKMSPYIIGCIFIVTLCFTDSSFTLSKFLEHKLYALIQ